MIKKRFINNNIININTLIFLIDVIKTIARI